MRVALFSGNYNCVRDGANKALNRLVAHLLARGAAVRVYAPTAPRPAFEPSGDLVSVRSIAIPGRAEYRLAVGMPKRVREDIERFAPTIVHLSAPDPLGIAAARLARRMDVPVVASLHTRFETYFDYYGLGMFRRLGERHLRRFYRGCDLVLAPNAPLAASLIAMGVDEPRLGIWSRGVDPAVFRPELRSLGWRRSRGVDDDEILVLFFGRLVVEKGLDTFARTIAALRGRGVAFKLLVVGAGPAEAKFRSALPDAIFTGHLEGEALGTAIASADILLNPSVTEAFGNVNLEAMASGLVVVSADIGSAQALIESGRSGVLVAPEPAAMASQVARLAQDAALRHRLGSAAARAASLYCWDEVLDDVVRAYRSLQVMQDR